MRASRYFRRRLSRLAVVAVAATAVASLGMSPAEAATPWTPSGYVPVCDHVAFDGTNLNYTDATDPTFRSITTKRYVALTKTPSSPRVMTVRVSDACSGVQSVVPTLVFNDSPSAIPMATVSGSVFDGVWGLSLADESLLSGELGRVEWQVVYAWDRYSAFTLDRDHTSLISSTARTVDLTTGASIEPPTSSDTFLLRKSYASNAASSKGGVAKGAKVTLSSRFTVATATSPATLAAVKVQLQRKLPGGGWKNLGAKVTTSSTGLAKVSIKPTATASYRYVYAGRFASPWNAPVTSKAVKVTVH